MRVCGAQTSAIAGALSKNVDVGVLRVRSSTVQSENVLSQNSTRARGTLMVLEKFYDTPIDKLPKNPGFIGGWYYRIT
jgi:hypothetical protein